jgi:hypothetical protein
MQLNSKKNAKMSKGILRTIKAIIIVFTIGFMALAKKGGVSIIVANTIGFAIIFAVWKYEPNKDNNNQQLDKK